MDDCAPTCAPTLAASVTVRATTSATLIGRQDRQFYWLLGLDLAGAAAILGVMAHGFRWL